MERTRLKAARKDRNLRQREVAEAIGCSIDALGMWERGAEPSDYYKVKLCAFYGKSRAQLGIGDDPHITEGQLAMLQNILGSLNLDRRQALELVKQVPALGVLVELLAESPSGILAPPQFLSQSTAAISACWQLMDSGGYATVEDILVKNTSTLESLATEQSEYQEEASSLLTQAKIMQIRLATRNRNWQSRKALCLEAVQFGELSGDSLLHAAALYWHGDTYVYCYHRPQKAIDIFKDGMRHVNSDTPLCRVALCNNLAIAEALQRNESLAQGYLEQARKAMPTHLGQDPAYLYGGWSDGTLDKLEGRMHLTLAEHLPGYAKTAHKIFGEGVDKYTHQGELSQALIYQADAALMFGDLDEYSRCLKKGWLIAVEIDSQNHKHEARKVLGKAQQVWRNERKYQNLIKVF